MAILPPEPRVPFLTGDRISPEWLMYFNSLMDPFFEWRHASDFSKIDGADIYANSITLTNVSGDLDDIDDGTTYGRVAVTSITAGKIVLAGLATDVTDQMFTTTTKRTNIEAGLIDIIGDMSLQNMLKNGGFEEVDGDGDAYYWGTGTGIQTETSAGNNSNNYLRLTKSGASITTYYVDKDGNQKYFEVNEGETYELGADCISNGGVATYRVDLLAYDKDKGGGTQVGTVSGVSAVWTAENFTYTIASGRKFLSIRCHAVTTDGWVGYDNFYLKRIDEKAWSWSHASDRTTIDGGNIYTGSIVGDSISLTSYLAINSATWQAQGVQIQYNGGTPRFYCGNGEGNYFYFDGINAPVYSGDLAGSSAGSYVVVKSDDLARQSATSYTKTKEILVARAGVYTVSFNLGEYNNGVNNTVYGRIYKNGVAHGTARSNSDDWPTSTTYSEDLTFVSYDLIQVYAYRGNGAGNDAAITDFRVKSSNPQQAAVQLD